MRLLITIDTEGDNLWGHPRQVETRNSRFLGRFQALCEKYGLLPTYLTDYEMALCPVFHELATDALRRGTAEVGMHLHAWNTPPLEPLTEDDIKYAPYLIEYPERLLRDKVRLMTELLEQRFGVKMTSHRAGRWAFNGIYARCLLELGYEVDCSVVPGVSFREHPGDPKQHGGTDYTGFPREPYYLDLADISRKAAGGLLEAPMTVMDLQPGWAAGVDRLLGGVPRKAWRRFYPVRCWLRPRGGNAREMIRVVQYARAAGLPHVEFMLHSSEFMPGGSPTFPTEASVERLYEDLETLFTETKAFVSGSGLTAFAREWSRQRGDLQ